MQSERHGIAPYDLIQRDFRELDATDNLRTTWDIERLILIQSIQGHTHEGHGAFHGHRFPNTSIDDISSALHLDPVWVRTERQQLIDEIKAYVDLVIGGDENPPLLNSHGAGFLGSSMFRHMEVSGHDVLRGLYIGGLRDDPTVRFEMEKKYGITIGGGKCYLVNTKVMDKLQLNADDLAHGAHEDMIDYYRQTGLIVADGGRDTGDLEYLYIRFRRGHGASDDSAIVIGGLLYGYGAAVGVFLADAIDTLEKHVPVFSDQDEDLSRYIKEKYTKLDLGEADIRRLAFLSAEPEDERIDVPDSSLRHLLRIDPRHDITPIESHLMFVQGKQGPPTRIGHEEMPSEKFYNYIQERMLLAPGLL